LTAGRTNRSVLLGFSSLFGIEIFPVFENAAFRFDLGADRHEPGARKNVRQACEFLRRRTENALWFGQRGAASSSTPRWHS